MRSLAAVGPPHLQFPLPQSLHSVGVFAPSPLLGDSRPPCRREPSSHREGELTSEQPDGFTSRAVELNLSFASSQDRR